MNDLFELTSDIKLMIQLSGVDYPNESPGFRMDEYEYEDLAGAHGTDVGSRLGDVTPIRFQERVVFSGYLKTLPHLDYLMAMPRTMLMNQKVLDVLLAVGEFEYEVLPARIMDVEDPDLHPYPRRFSNDALAAQHPHSDDYFILHLTSHTRLPEGLDTSVVGLPPVLIPDPRDGLFGLYVTRPAKEELVAAQIHGVDFRVPYRRREPLKN